MKDNLIFLDKYINGSDHHLLLGEAGSGKSVLIYVLKKYYGDEMLLGASTGVSNQNLMNGEGGSGTSHKIFSINTTLGNEAEMKKVKRGCSNLFAGSDLIKHVCIDEFFMHNSEHLHVMLKRIERFNKKTAKRSRRQIRLLGVGDPLQIGSVLRDNDKPYLQKTYGSHLMFRSSVWGQFNPTITVLDVTERQKDKVFVAALEVLRYGQEHRYDGVLKWLNKRVNYNFPEDAFTIATYKKTVDAVNKLVLDANSNRKITFNAVISGKVKPSDLDVEEIKILCEGLECITTVNDNENDLYSNGSSCIITQVTTEGCYCFFTHNQKEVFVGLHEYELTESYVDTITEDGVERDILKTKTVGTIHQIPLLQNSAYTCHRAQGKTFTKEGVLDVGYGFREGQDFGQNILYVGLSRFVDIDLVTLPRPLQKKHIKVCRDSINFWHECVEAQNKEN